MFPMAGVIRFHRRRAYNKTAPMEQHHIKRYHKRKQNLLGSMPMLLAIFASPRSPRILRSLLSIKIISVLPWNGWCRRCSRQSSPCSSSGCWLWSSFLSGQLISFVVAQICFEITSVAHKGMKWQTSLTSQELKSCCHPPLCKSAGQNKKGVQTNSKQDLFFQHSLHAGYLYKSIRVVQDTVNQWLVKVLLWIFNQSTTEWEQWTWQQ